MAKPKRKAPYFLLTIFLLIGSFGSKTFGQFSLNVPFTGNTVPPQFILGGQAGLTAATGIDPLGAGWLRLVPDNNNQTGYCYVNYGFPSNLGVIVEFEYKAWSTKGGEQADGISFFLFDGKYGPEPPNKFAAGQYGGQLGYAEAEPGFLGENGPGLTGGYIGLGLDEYGNYSHKQTKYDTRASANRIPQSIALRGLTAEHTTYITGTGANLGGTVYAGGTINYPVQTATRPDDGTYYRKVRILLQRRPDKYQISAYMQISPTGTMALVFGPEDLPVSIPDSLKLGFAASTGGSVGIHEVRLLTASTPGAVRIIKNGPTAVSNGETFTYQVDVFNDGANVLNGVPVTDTFPPGFSVTNITFNNNGYTNNTYDGMGTVNNGIFSGGKLNLDTLSRSTFFFTGKISFSDSAPAIIKNVAYAKVPAGFPDPDQTNDTSKLYTFRKPLINQFPPQAICNGENVTDTAVTMYNATIKWTTTTTGNITLGNPTGSVVADASGKYVFTSNVKNNGTTPATVTYTFTPSYTYISPLVQNLPIEVPGDPMQVTLTVNPTPSITSVTVNNAGCNGDSSGSATITMGGQTAPYTYLWSNGATTATAANLPAGTYSCTVTDVNGCDTTVNATITQPAVLNVITSATNVPCNGDATGAATATASGGTQPYNYLWSNGATTATASGLAAGTYSCTITDAGSCDTTVSVIITQPPAISFTTSKTDVLCNGDATGIATVTVSGGVPPYSYNWSNGKTTSAINGLAAGTYTCTITDNNGCDTTASITIIQPTPITTTVSKTNVSCNGGNDGSASLVVSGGAPPYTYLWFTKTITDSLIDGLTAGIYNCTIKDANGCDTTVSILITEPSILSFTTTQTNISCNGDNTGSATVTANGGTGPYSYLWSNNATTATIDNLTAGIYTCTITDANGCDTTASVTITQASAINFLTSQTNVLCNGAATGVAGVTVSGGTPPYTYLWSNGATTATTNNLTAGIYTCVITDANGCDTTASITITETGAITFTTAKTDVSCNGYNTGTASVNVSNGGTAPYTYNWAPFGGTGATANNLTAGTYTCTITDVNGCDTTATIVITEPTVISFTSSQTNILCYGTATGGATLTVSGGVSPYTYNWTNGATTATITDVIAGTYTCTITDANGCDTTASVTITQLDPITFTVSQTNALCNGQATGSATVAVSGGGTAPYVYSWSPSGGTAPTANGLVAGTYTCTVTDANGCDTTVSFTITEPTALTAAVAVANVSCNGANDGKALALVHGGVTPYTYHWAPGGETTDNISDLGPGTYTCTVTDANGCTFIGTFQITEPPLLTSASSHTDITCNGGNDGSATATASGGTTPYTYSWSNGGTTETINDLAAGAYTCTITDAKGCTTTTSVTVSEPSPVSATVSATDVTCYGLTDGSATVNPSGGTPSYTYLWSNGGTTQTINNLAPGNYTVTVTDNNGCTFDVTSPAVVNQPDSLSVTTTQTNVGCNGEKTGIATVHVTGGTAPYSYQWSPSGGTGATATGLGAGTYTCNITDANGCATSASVTITENTSLTISFTENNISCKGVQDGSITAVVSGGVAPYTYKWTPGGATTATISNLGPGSYTCVITDASGCSIIQTAAITDPPILQADIDTFTSVTCNGACDGTATVNVTGGTAPYTYSWSPSGGTGATATGLCPGTYTCTVTDANGCTTTTSSVIITEQPALDADIFHTNVTSSGANDGTATVDPSGGTPPYTYSWTPGGETTATITGLPPGTYTCTITDANGCTITETVIVTEPDVLTITASETDIDCNGENNGTATVSAAGGTPPYTYSWTPGGETTATITGLAPGTYTCIVTDAANAKDTVSVTIDEPTPITAIVSVDTIFCNGSNTGSIALIAQGGTPLYSYLWSNGATTPTIDNLPAGTYSCTITDANGCAATISGIIVPEPAPLTVVVDTVNVSCYGLPDGSATITVSGGTAPYSYNWSPTGGSGPFATGLVPGTYTCTITDANGCDTTISVTITQPDALTASATKTDISCFGANDGIATAVITGGTTPYSYLWDPNNETTATINNLSPGTYTCTVTDFNGCIIIGTVEITQPAKLTATVTVVNASCNGSSDGSATANASGGITPYKYSWSTGDTTQTINGLQRGSYSCVITDSNGCVITTTATISEPDIVSANINKNNVSCNAGTDGSITASGTGGTAPYTYSWDNGETTATINNLTAGVYVCTITDAHNCTGTVTVVISEPAALSVNTTQTNASCNGNSDGIASADVSGGTGPYTYQWAPSGGTGPTATGLAAGTYTCTITDQKGCILIDTVIITEPNVLVAGIDQVNVSCKGAADATVTLTPSGGTAPYTYSWSTGDTTAIVTDLAPGTYTFIVRDVNNCEFIQTIEITEPGELTATTNFTNVSCHGGSDGSVTVIPSQGTLPYSYLWMPGGATTASVTGLTAGSYTCTITDANGCTITRTVTVSEPTALTVNTVHANVTCNGAADGTASVTVSGGTPSYNYSWSNGAATSSVSNLAPGIYFCTVTDNNGCDTTVTILITQPGVLSFTISHTNNLCNGDNTGTATVTPSGGTAPYTYSWSPAGGTDSMATGLTAGMYTCTITDANGCDTTASVTIAEPGPISFTTAHTNVSCNGGSDGSASVIVSGGTPPYSYSWNNGASSPVITGLAAGTYTCTVTDANSCDTTISVTISEPDVISFTTSHTNVSCNGSSDGSASVIVSGGIPPYSYSWNNGASSPVITGLAAGTYTCVITDAHGCDTTFSISITEPAVLMADVTAKTNVLCHGDNTGSATVTVSGGTAPYTYQWSPGGGTDPVVNGLGAGLYVCIVTDANGCTASAITLITQPPAIAFTTTQTNVACNGNSTGSAAITVTGGTEPYNYLWSNGATTASVNNLAAGIYTCTITDSNGCDTTATITITEASLITFTTDQTNIGCNGNNTGAASVTVTGGVAPYSYSWSTGAATPFITGLTAGTYTCIITDANGCDTTATVTITEPTAISVTISQNNISCNGDNSGEATVNAGGGTSPYSYLWSTGETAATATNLTAGTYTCTITDANGCDTTASVTITEAPAITFTKSQVNILCNGDSTGSATVTAGGGTPPLNYLWNTGDTTSTITNLAAGGYYCIITDANGCDTITGILIIQPDSLEVTTSQTDILCNGDNTGSAAVTVTGGTFPYTYNWSNGETTATITNLTAGTYTCTITDANGCDTTIDITISEPPAIAFTTTQTNVACNGGNTGSVTVTASGGTGPYSYQWSNGDTTAAISNLAAGTYSCLITDANACDTVFSITITEPSLLSFTTSQTNVACNGGNTGEATVNVTGGTSPYSYLWNNGETTATINNLAAGIYTCTITDANGCDTTATVTISESPALTVTTAQTDVACNGGNTGSATVNVSGGASPYAYLWSNGETTAAITNLAAGTYTCTVSDANNCDTIVTVIITEPTALNFTITQNNIACNGGNTGSATVTVDGGTPAYTYLWSNGATTATIDNLTAGTYSCLITDANGCDTTATVVVTEAPLITFTTSQTNVACNGGNTGSATVTVDGGTSPYTYLWNNGASTATIDNLVAGTYTCTITDANGCDTTATVTITEAAAFDVTTSQTNVACNGGNTGSATVNITGGTVPYTYSWSDGGTTATITNLTAGTYTCIITDANGCDTTATVTITEPDAISFTTSQTNVGCNGGNDGSITVTVNGGTTPYTYSWSNGATTATIDNLTAGTYSCLVTDANDCDTAFSITITEPPVLSFTTSQTNVACNGGNTGSATVTVSGGTTPYTYNWSNGGTAVTIDNLTAGTYTCTITDANGCDTTASITITEPTAISFTTSQTNVACNGGNTGSATVTVNGGTSPYTYLWSNSAATATIDNLTAGIYTCTITDANGCDTTATVTITEPDAISFTTSQTNVACNGGNTGSATVTVSGGTAPYAYIWSNGATTATADNLAAGTYTCTITDANGCDTTASVTITEAAAFEITATQTNVACNGDNTGSASIDVSGGTAPYSYSWSNGEITSAINNLAAGTYTCTITDASGCDTTASITITEPTAISFTISQTNVNCNGGNTGSATVTADGGTSPYTYLWNNGATTTTIDNLTAGTYTCTITDANGCDTTATVIITEASLITFTTTQTNVACNGGNTGSATVNVTGGTAPYTYSWSNGSTNATITNLITGSYTCIITDANGCDTTATVTITEPDALSFTTSQTNVSCNGGNDGSITVTVNGGTAPYTYNWSNGAATASIDNLIAGTYSCLVTDANGCDTAFSITITEPPVLSFTTSQTNVTCNGGSTGSATVTISGGTTPYAYLWSNGATTATIDNLTAGTYTCTITDANGCDTTASITITEPTLITFTTSQTNVDCNGGNTGSATVTVDGGTPPYTYLWNNGTTTATIDNLAAGTYTCTITDANGCDTTATVVITQPDLVTAVITAQTNVSCNGGNDGSATALASGGTAPYSYSWSNGATTGKADNLSAGTYTCTITDVNSCTTTVTATITEPTLITFTTSQTNVDCNGGNTGSATVTADGGTPPYTYLWSNGATTATINNLAAGTYTCTITDANGCDTTATVVITQPDLVTAVITAQTNVSCNGGNDGSATALASGGTAPYSYSWSNGATTGKADNLAAGTYTCTITDANGCTTTVTATITEPTLITFTTSQTNVDCNGGSTGSATVTVDGGTTPYTYLWNNGATTATIDNLAAGTYSCVITDANGCDTTATVVITQPDLVTAVITAQTNVSCNGGNDGSATALASGGTAPYSYSWSNGATTGKADNLPAGTYTCTITDANGCTTTVTATITEPTLITFTTSQTNVDCNGGSTGSATVTVDGGTTPYTYLWNNGATTATIDNLAAGTYSCVITDANGCDTTATVVITQPDLVTAVITAQTNVSCNGGNDGSATALASGGTAPYSYSWSNGATTGKADNLSAGTYTCTITDANGCTTTVTATITEPTLITFTTSQTNVDCNGGNTGSATVTVDGGTTPYSYLWSNGATTATINNLAAGTYTCTITDANGCDTTATVVITQPDLVTAVITAQTNVSCNGGNDGSATALASGGTAPYTYSWSNGATTGKADNLSAGTYTCTITDANGCTTTVTATITEPTAISFTTSQTNVDCNGGNTGSATVTVDGGTTPYTYLWNNGATTATINNLAAGTYTCTITDANGCDTTATVVITQPDLVTAVITAQTNVSCNGGNDGSATALASGGTAPYSYSWSNGATTGKADNLAAGTYTCTITDANGCITTVTATITEPTLITFTTSQTNVDCNGGSTGSATVTVDGGTTPYTYLWSNGATTATINNLAAGTYSCIITDANGCDTTATVVITQPDLVTAVITAQTNVSCNGGNDGSATALASGGTAPYTYSWSNGATTGKADNLPAGTYTCTITDANGCITTVTATITEPTLITFTTSQTNVDCNGGSTGSATVTVDGGTPPYTYLWTNGGTTATINDLAAGTYTCTITDANGCDTTATVVITQPDLVTAVITAQTNVSCNGGNDGSATALASGGTAPYTYSWSNGATTGKADNLSAGTYTCTITDANGCITTVTATITEPTLITFTTSQTNVDCNGGNTGSATVTVDGGTPPYTYLWTNGATTATIDNLAAGTYTCTIIDANGCDTTATVVITQPDLVTAVITAQTNVSCNGGNDGSATALASGGTAPYSYSWSNGATTGKADNLAAGTYTCTITDANGCTTTVTATITEPTLITFTTAQTNVDCNGGNTGSATVTVSGGTTPYTYLWNNGTTTATIDNLAAGTYSCVITDANGCDTTATVVITQPDLVTAVITAQTNVSCNGGNDGSATALASGGTAPYSYSWSNGSTGGTATGLSAGIYTCTITDANGCTTTVTATVTEPTLITFTTSQTNVDCNGGNTGSATVTVSGGTAPYTYLWNNGATTATINNLAAGTYSCVITDANGCDTTATVVITQPDLVTAVITAQTNVSCNGGNDGSATALASGGTAPYSYSWSNGATTGKADNLAAGTYTCTITDANGCTTTVTATITEPTLITFTTSQTNVDCNGGNTGSATVTVSGGTTPYTYLWSNGATTATINNLAAGTYSCVITDANGCDTTAAVTITEASSITFTTSQTNVACNGDNTGSATVNVTGGTGPYSYTWSNGATTAAVNNLTAGTYTCIITGAGGCDTTATLTITEPAALAFTTTQINVPCNNAAVGSATVTVSGGGTAPYTYLWNNGATTATISNLTKGTYTCTITDANGCDTTATVTITEAPVSLHTTTQTGAACYNAANGTATVTVSGGTAPYSYLWSNGETTSSVNDLAPGTYTLTITDANGCDTTVSINILSVQFTASKTVDDGNRTGTVEGSELLTYTIRVTNTGSAPIDSILISDPVPVYTTFVSSSQGTVVNNTVLFTDTNLGINEERSYLFVVRADDDLNGVAVITNDAQVATGINEGNCTENPSVNIPVFSGRLPTNLGITKQSELKAVTVGDTYEYTIIVSNSGATARPVTVTDTMPSQITYVSSSASEGTVNYNNNTRILIWQIDSLPDLGVERLTLRVRADEFGTVVNTARVSSPQEDVDTTNNASTDSKEVIPFKIPNVFTPNGDGRNETFFIKGLDLYQENQLLIFNRWNANVYQKRNYQNDWDGAGLNEGTYFYILRLRDNEGKWHEYKGNVLILRR